MWLIFHVCLVFFNSKIPKYVAYGKKKEIFFSPSRRELHTYVSYAFISLHFSVGWAFYKYTNNQGLMDQLHTKTSTSSPQMGPTQVPPTLWLTTSSSRKFCVCSPLARYWELNQRAVLLLESLHFRGRQNLTVSLKRLVSFDHLLHI